MRLCLAGLGLAGWFVAAAPARADPCQAPLPDRAGTTFVGIVRYVIDGDSLCLGATRNPDAWIEVRLADRDAAELEVPGGEAEKARLRDLVLGRQIHCIAVRGRLGRVTVHDRVIALCRLEGRDLGFLLRR